MQTQKTVKFSLLFTLIFAFVATTVAAIGGVMKKEKQVENKNQKVSTQKVWYELALIPNQAGTDISHYEITDILAVAPPEEDEDGCAQENEVGKFCAIELEFSDAEDPEDAVGKDVSTAMDDLDADHTGESRNPSIPL